MANVIVKERVYVDVKGQRVPEGSPKAYSLAAAPGDEITEARAAQLGLGADAKSKAAARPRDEGQEKAKAEAEAKAREEAENKARAQGENKGRT